MHPSTLTPAPELTAAIAVIPGERILTVRTDVPGPDVVQAAGDLEDLPYESASFDCAVCDLGGVLRPRAVLAELHRVVRPGGRLAFTSQGALWDDLAAIACWLDGVEHLSLRRLPEGRLLGIART